VLGLVAVNWKAARDLANPHVRMNVRPGSLKVLGLPLPQLWVLRLLPDKGVLHDSVADVIDDRRL
jgi:hypothetical protein